MKKYVVGCWAIASAFALASCQEDVKSEAPAAVRITSPQAGEKVWLTTPITVETAAAQAGDKVMFYLDDELVGEDTEAPYEVMLDTKQYEDGAYTLRTVVQNGSGEPTEAVRTINIFNKLFSLKVDNNYLEEAGWSPKEAWIIVCDTEGDIIQTEELRNGETATIDRHDRTDENLIVTLVKVHAGSRGNQYVIVESYQGITPNAWFLEGYTPADKAVVGTAQVDYTVPEDIKTLTSAFNASVSLSKSEEGYRTSLDILKEPAGLFIANHAQDGNAADYAWLDDIRVDQQRRLSVEDFHPMKLMQQVSFQRASNLYFSMSGIGEQTGGYHNFFKYDTRDEVPSTLSVHYPEGLFTSYRHYVAVSQDEVTYYHVGNDALKSSYAVPELSAEVTSLGQEQKVRIQGNHAADFAQGRWEYYSLVDDVTNVVAWYVSSPLNEGEYRALLHDFPTVITDRHELVRNSQQDMQYKATDLPNYDSTASLPDYLRKRYLVDEKFELGAYEEVSIRATGSQGGRTGADLPKRVAEEIERLRTQ